MNISQITGIFFSPTGTTKQVTEWIAERIAADKEAGWLDLTDAISSDRIIRLTSMNWRWLVCRCTAAGCRRLQGSG